MRVGIATACTLVRLNKVISVLLCSMVAFAASGQGHSPIGGMARIEAVGQAPAGKVEKGSGFVVAVGSEGAYVITAQHVIKGASKIRVYFAISPDAAPSAARVVMADEKLDLVVLLAGPFPSRVEVLPLQLALEPGLGEQLFMIGYSVGGRLPAVRQAALVQHQGAEFFLQTQVDEMDSGSPLIYGGGVAGWVKEEDGAYARCASASVLATALRGWQVPFTSAGGAVRSQELRRVEPTPVVTQQTGACTGRVISATGGSKQVFQGAGRNSPIAGTLPEGTAVSVIGQRFSDGKPWYRITADNRVTGYLPQSDLELAGNCSNNN